MTVTYGFYDSISGDRRYNAAQMGAIFNGIITDGIFAAVGDAFIVKQNSPIAMSVLVGSGRSWFNGTWVANDADVVRTVEASEAVLNRIDSVVIETNMDTRTNQVKIVKGTPASSPVPPTLSNTATVKQYALADIAVAAGVTTISTANITNRVGTTGAQFITGPLQVINLTNLLNQYAAQFDLWLDSFVNQLTSEQATNLQNQINELVSGWINSTETWTYVSFDGPTFTISTPGDLSSKYRPGLRFKATQTTIRYFIITSVNFTGGNTVLTLFGGTHSVMDNAAISNPQYSMQARPVGLPNDRNQWTVTVQDTTQRQQASPTQNIWYNPGSVKIDLPIGNWRLTFSGSCQVRVTTSGTASNAGFAATLSTANNSESNTQMTARFTFPMPNTLTNATGRGAFFREMPIAVAVKTPFYANISTGVGGAVDIEFPNNVAALYITAICDYF